MKWKLVCLLGVLFSAGILSAEEWKRDFTVTAHPQLRVQTNNARVEIRGVPGTTVSARVVADGWRIGPGDVAVNAQQSGDSISVQVKVPERHLNFTFGVKSVRIEVNVPFVTALDVASSDGALHVVGVKGGARLITSDGPIRVENFDGNLRARTSDGPIDVAGRFDQLDLNTSDGPISASVWKGSHMNGNWNLRTSDGAIRVGLPEDFAAFIDAWTSDSHIDLQVPVEVSGRMERNRVRGKLRGGGPTLQIHTSDGNITVRSI